MAANDSLITILRDIRDVKYVEIVAKNSETTINAAAAGVSAVAAAASASASGLSQTQAAASATSASSSAQTATAESLAAGVAKDAILANISTASLKADEASLSATNAAASSSAATIKAGEAAASATAASTSASNASISEASAAASSANSAVKSGEANSAASAAAASAATATAASNTATTKASEAAASAVSAAASAATATTKADAITNMTTTTQTLTAGSPSTASFNSSTGLLTFGIPIGTKGDRGDAFSVSAIGLAAGKSAYDAQPKDFSYLATDVGLLYFKLSATSGDWSTGVPFGKGDKGDKGDATLWRYGTVAPSNAVGVDGDLYLNTAMGATYARVSGAYVLQGTLSIINDTTASATSVYSSNKVNTLLGEKSDTSHVHSAATTSVNGFMSAADKTKIDGIAALAEVNQNTFSTIAVSGQTSVAADSKTDTLTLIAGTNVTITTDAANDTVTINANDASVGWSEITSKPTTVAGYGIADAQPLDADLTAMAALVSTGIITKTGAGTATTRALTAGSTKVAITNGDGVLGNPTVDVNEANLTLTNIGGTLTVAKGGTGVATLTGIVKANGTGAMSAAVAGTDYVVPSGSITGNAATATKLAATKTIDGVAFDGSANIDIENRIGTAIASAGTTSIGAAGIGNTLHITGVTTITSFGTASIAGTTRRLVFDSALTLTHNATSLICPAAANINILAGDSIEVVCEHSGLGYWRVTQYTSNQISATELSYLNNTTSNIQTQLDGKAVSAHTHTLANISDFPSTISATELGYLDGATSAIQNQINDLALGNTYQVPNGTTTLTLSTANIKNNGYLDLSLLTSNATLTLTISLPVGFVFNIIRNGAGTVMVDFTTGSNQVLLGDVRQKVYVNSGNNKVVSIMVSNFAQISSSSTLIDDYNALYSILASDNASFYYVPTFFSLAEAMAILLRHNFSTAANITASNAAYVLPSTACYALVIGIGGGGGGEAGIVGNTHTAGGGMNGAMKWTLIKTNPNAVAATLNITIGAGGAGGTTTTPMGTDGLATTVLLNDPYLIDMSILSCAGGAAYLWSGYGMTASDELPPRYNAQFFDGTIGTGTDSVTKWAGLGGRMTFLAKGGNGGNAAATPTAGVAGGANTGAGGGGGAVYNTARSNGGAGGSGKVIVLT